MNIKSRIHLADGVDLVRRNSEAFNLFIDDRMEGVVVFENDRGTAFSVCYINRNASLVCMRFANHTDALSYVRRNYAGLVADTYIDAHRRGRV